MLKVSKYVTGVVQTKKMTQGDDAIRCAYGAGIVA